MEEMSAARRLGIAGGNERAVGVVNLPCWYQSFVPAVFATHKDQTIRGRSGLFGEPVLNLLIANVYRII